MKWWSGEIRAPGIWPEQEYRATSTLARPSSMLLDAFGAREALTGERVTVGKAMELAAVRSAVAMIAQAVGGLPLKVYRIDEDSDERVEARQHRTWRMLHDKPNEHCTATNFWTTCAAHLLIYENALIYKQRDEEDVVEALYLFDPGEWRVEFDGLRKKFIWNDPAQTTYSEEQVLHIVGFSLDGYYGSSRLSQARQTLGTALARARFEGGFYKRGAKFSGAVEHPGRLGESGVKRLSEQLSLWHSGSASMHKIPVLEEGASFKSVSMSLEDMQFAQLAEQTRTEIAILFNIPPAYLGATTGDSLTYATTESNQIQFAQMAVLPIANTIAKALSSDPAILPWNVMFCEFVLEGLLRADMKTRAEYWEKMQKILNLSPEFIAGRENIPHDAIKEPKPPPRESSVPLDRDGNGELLPPEMAQMQNALKSA